LFTFQGFINLWSFGNLKIKHLNPQRDVMDHRFSHSRKWKKQRVLSVKKIWLEKGDLDESIEASCGQERYFFLTENFIILPGIKKLIWS
jgi:hypothetical protein